jgi:5-methylcytosine-specific restriction endonuclease McrA
MDLETKYHIIASIKRGFLTHPFRKIALEKAKVANQFKCSCCLKLFSRETIQVDHIHPIAGFKNWDEFIERLFVGPDKLQVLCKKCHREKTNKEVSNLRAQKKRDVYLKNRTIFQEMRDEQEELMKQPCVFECFTS